jgi:diaminohydroxyphosphoribosylaminopyrimidine deaminase/5-amino-6-(5-phosphoribosylamino)uracil reductase
MVDRDYMELALRLANRAAGHVSPDPMVGAVIVNNGEIVGQGYYEEYGKPHAEAIAIREAGEKCRGATIYTNLEPCCHHGKNPPCSDAIVKSGIKRVVSAIRDPNPKVNGGGFEQLEAAGVEVEGGLMMDEAIELNEVFLKYITTCMPFVLLSIAQTIDSKIAQTDGHSQWITGEESRKEVHRLRSEYDAVLVGANTVRVDNPQLTVRHVQGRNPKRIIVSGSSPLPLDSNVFTDKNRESTIVACPPALVDHYAKLDGPTVWEIRESSNGHISLMNLFIRAGKEKIASIFVEGGRGITTSLLTRKLIDKIEVSIAPIVLGNGLSAIGDLGAVTLNRAMRMQNVRYSQLGTDMRIIGYPEWR